MTSSDGGSFRAGNPRARSAGPVTILGRGARGRCGRCGAGGIFRSWFRLRERCPRCGYGFEREEGAFTGAWLVNYAFGLVPFLVLITVLIVRLAAGHDVSVLPFLIAAAAIAVVMPILTYPLAKSTWAALDLAMRPLGPVEEAEAARHASDGATRGR